MMSDNEALPVVVVYCLSAILAIVNAHTFVDIHNGHDLLQQHRLCYATNRTHGKICDHQ